MPEHRHRLESGDAAPSALAASLAALRDELELPTGFPAAVLEEAERSARRTQVDASAADVDDLRSIAFATIDPPGSTDLDQALAIDRTGDGAVLHYAIADVPAFVAPGGALDLEARRRGQTRYAVDGRVPLHPVVISEDAASLLPGLDRRAIVWRFELDVRADVRAVSVSMAVVRSRRRWTYAEVQAAIDDGTAPPELAALAWFGPRRIELERERGGASLDVPETRIVVDDGPPRIEREPTLAVEGWNAQVSLMTGMAAARIMLDGGIGLLRTMPPAADEDVAAFRAQTVALGRPWAEGVEYGEYLRSLRRDDPAALGILDAATGLFRGAGYTAFDGEPPAHVEQAAIGAPYAHATAPLRRLVDRWALVICEALANGREVPAWARESLPELPAIMAASDAISSRLASGSLDRVEAAVLAGREGDRFEAVVLRRRGEGGRVQLLDPPVTAPVERLSTGVGGLTTLRLVRVDVADGTIELDEDGARA